MEKCFEQQVFQTTAKMVLIQKEPQHRVKIVEEDNVLAKPRKNKIHYYLPNAALFIWRSSSNLFEISNVENLTV